MRMHMRIVGSRIDDTFGLLVATTIIKGYDYIKSPYECRQVKWLAKMEIGNSIYH